MISPITKNESFRRIPSMPPFHEPSQVTIPRLRRFRNEISFASPRGGGVSRGFPALPFSYPAAQPVASSSSSLPIFSSFRFEERESRLGIRHQGVCRKDFVTERYYSAFSNATSERLSRYSLFSLHFVQVHL